MAPRKFAEIAAEEIASFEDEEAKLKEYNDCLISRGKQPVTAEDVFFQKAIARWMESSESPARKYDDDFRWYHWTPIINLLYDIFLDEPLEETHLKELLNLLGLIAALLLSVAGGFPGAVNFQEIQDALGRYSEKDDVSWSFCVATTFNPSPILENQRYKTRCNRILELGNSYVTSPFSFLKGGGHFYINSFGNFMNASLGLMTMSLLGTIFIYMFLVVTSFEAPRTGIVSQAELIERRRRLYSAWWKYVQIALFYVVICLVSGLFCLFYTIHSLIVIKVPDVFVEERNDFTFFGFNPVFQFVIWGFGGICGGTVFIVLLLSRALRSKYQLYFKLKTMPAKGVVNENTDSAGIEVSATPRLTSAPSTL